MTRDELIERVASKLGSGGPCPGAVIQGAASELKCRTGCQTSEAWRKCWATEIVDLVLGEMKEDEEHDQG